MSENTTKEISNDVPAPVPPSPPRHVITNSILANSLLVIVILMGATNFAAQFFVSNYTPDATVTLLFAGVAGLILGVRKGDNK